MKYLKIIFLTALLSMATNALAQSDIDAFKEGSVWNMQYVSMVNPDSPDSHYCGEMSIEGECEIRGLTCMILWSKLDNEPRKLYGYLYKDDQKIYLVSKDEDHKMGLLYDFGLAVGDTTKPIEMEVFDEPYGYLKFDTLYTKDICGHTYEVMDMSYNMNIYDKYLGKEETLSTPHAQTWIKGIGDTQGLLRNNIGDYVGQSASSLASVYVDGELVYSKDEVAISSIEKRQATTIYYDLQGRRCNSLQTGSIVFKLNHF